LALARLIEYEAQLGEKIASGQIGQPAATDLQNLADIIEAELDTFSCN
jgi:hypothetical protein